MARMTGGEALVQSLYREGVRVIFGLPGVQLYGVMAALRDEPRIRFIATRHEQATSYMADGYARAGGDFGTAFVVPGPGLLNAASGLSTAYSASSPVLMIAGQIPKGSIGKNIGLLHEVNDQLDAIAPITKWRQRILEIADIPASVREAVRQLKTGRPRPVEIELSPETMEDEGEAELLPASEFHRAAAPSRDIDRMAEMLLAAKNPVIYAGGGVHLSGANAALAAVAEYLQAGVIESPEGKGAVSDASDLALGAAFWRESPLYGYLHAADVVLAVGSRLALVTFKKGQRIIHLDVDPEEIGRNHPNTTGLVGDVDFAAWRLGKRENEIARGDFGEAFGWNPIDQKVCRVYPRDTFIKDGLEAGKLGDDAVRRRPDFKNHRCGLIQIAAEGCVKYQVAAGQTGIKELDGQHVFAGHQQLAEVIRKHNGV